MMGQLFGTDGIRGIANEELTPELAFRVGQALGFNLGCASGAVVVGRDPRLSGDCLEAALCSGLSSVGIDVWRVGVVTTPAVAYLTRTHHAVGGVMISASHNPAHHNGIKVFAADGYKLNDKSEQEIERLVLDHCRDRYPRPTGCELGRLCDRGDLVEDYVQYLVSLSPVTLEGMRVVVDCANGSAFAIAPRVFAGLGVDVVPMAAEPDGININMNCGSTVPDLLVDAVRAHNADCGLALDGDADRLIAVDDCGEIVDGDLILAMLALQRRRRGERVKVVVGTVMTNSGLEAALLESGIVLHRSPVGDKYVLEAMRRLHATLGGEQSGHIIFSDHATTGDGILTGIQLLALLQESGTSLSKLASQLNCWPQFQRSVAVREPKIWDSCPRTRAAVDDGQRRLADRGRILIRPSGTEPVLRVLVEGQDNNVVEDVGKMLVEVIERFQGVETTNS